ncbi:MAG: hypothetical protein J3K34DRAFT_507631 [Monoraphidium minutum]|nr:MAG: hypothetical protein J3K34DRAFT_507631 [Monoraphidium minutum]
MAKQAGTCGWLLAAALVAICIQAASAAPNCNVNQASIQKTPFSIAYATESAYTVTRGGKTTAFKRYCFTLSDQALYAPNASLPAQSCAARNYTGIDCCASQADPKKPFKPLVLDFATGASCTADRKGLGVFKKAFWSMDPAATKKSNKQVTGKFSSNKWAVTIKAKTTIGASKPLCVNIPQTDPNQCKTLAQLCGNGANCGVVITSTKFTIPNQRGDKYCCVPTLVPFTAGLPAACPAGSGGDNATQACAPCAAGTYGSGLNATTPCMTCPGASISAGSAAACTACAANQVANTNKTACVAKATVTCNPGSGGSTVTAECAPCQPGTYGSGLNNTTPCMACANGTVANATGVAACTACASYEVSNANNTECSDPFAGGPPVCQSPTLTDQSGSYTLSQTPYGNNESCTITLDASASCAGFCDIFIFASGDTQAEDVLTFYTVPPSTSAADAANNPANIIVSVSGAFAAEFVITSSTTGAMVVRFTSDQIGVSAGWGFDWDVVTTPPVAGYPPLCASRNIDARQGSVSDGSGTEYYGDTEDCTTIIDTGCAGCNVQFTATGSIVDDPNCTLELTADGAVVFSRSGAIGLGTTVIPTVDGVLFLHFVCNAQGADQGWVFNWEIV